MSYEVRQPRSGSNPRLISFSRGLRALLLLALMVFFLPCDAQVCDSMDETLCLQTILDELVSRRMYGGASQSVSTSARPCGCASASAYSAAVRACPVLYARVRRLAGAAVRTALASGRGDKTY